MMIASSASMGASTTYRFLDDFLIGDESGFALNAQVITHNLRAYREQGHPPDEFQYERSASR